MPVVFAATEISWVQILVGICVLLFVPLFIGLVAFLTTPAEKTSTQRILRTGLSVVILSPVTWFLGFLSFAAAATMLLGDVGPLVIRSWFPGWLGLVCCAAVIGISFVMYFTESMKIDRGRRILLGALRAVTLCGIVFMLCKPVWVRDVKNERSRPVVILADNSGSMLLEDPRPALEDKVRWAIANDKLEPKHGLAAPASPDILTPERPTRSQVMKAVFTNQRLELVKKLREKGPVQPFLFGSRLRGFADTPEITWANSLSSEDAKSQITDTLAELFTRDENDLPAAIIIATDGRDNGSTAQWDDVALEAARLNIPIHVYGIGGSTAAFLQLKDAAIQDTLFIKDTVSVPFRWRAQGIKDGDVELTVTLGGKVVASKRVPVKDGQDVTETLTFTPLQDDVSGGKQEIVASVRIMQGNEEHKDRFAKMVRIADRKVKMLYIESNPRWEFKFMLAAFKRDHRVDPKFIVINGDRRAMEAGDVFLANFPDQRKDLFNFDLLVIGDVDANYFTGEQRNWIKDFVTEGGGLVVLAGRLHAPSSWLGTPLADVLPVEVPSVKFPIDDARRPSEFKPVRTDLGNRSSILSFADDPIESERAWDEFPGFYWHYPVTKLRPAALSLLDHPREKIIDDKPMPLLAMHYYGKGLVMFSAVEETWRWRYNEADKYFARYWGQVVYAIGLPHTLGSKTGQLAIAGGEAALGKPSNVYARLFTPEYRPLTKDRVTAQMERLDAPPGEEKFRTVVFEAVPNQPGEYVATVPNDRVGRYSLKVESGEETASLDYRVTLPPEHETAPGPMNEEALRKLAEQTGGKFYREEDLHKMAEQIETKKVSFTQRKETLLWSYWPLLVLIVGLFTAEWVLRKFSNMS
jgi:uncharacterized membrane protein